MGRGSDADSADRGSGYNNARGFCHADGSYVVRYTVAYLASRGMRWIGGILALSGFGLVFVAFVMDEWRCKSCVGTRRKTQQFKVRVNWPWFDSNGGVWAVKQIVALFMRMRGNGSHGSRDVLGIDLD